MASAITQEELAAAAAEADAASGLMARWAVLTEVGMLAGAGGLPAPNRISFQGDEPGKRPILALQFDTPGEALAWLDFWRQPADDRPAAGTTRTVTNARNFTWHGWTVQVHGWQR